MKVGSWVFTVIRFGVPLSFSVGVCAVGVSVSTMRVKVGLAELR